MASQVVVAYARSLGNPAKVKDYDGEPFFPLLQLRVTRWTENFYIYTARRALKQIRTAPMQDDGMRRDVFTVSRFQRQQRQRASEEERHKDRKTIN